MKGFNINDMNLNTLNKYYEEGWLIKQTHPTLPLTIMRK